MKFRLHHTINDVEDSFVLEGENVQKIKEQMKIWYAQRGIDIDKDSEKYHCWSERLED